MVSMCKDVLSDSVKRFVKTSREDLNALLTTSLRLRKFDISCCDYRTPGKETCCRLNYLYSVHFPDTLFPILDQNYRASIHESTRSRFLRSRLQCVIVDEGEVSRDRNLELII